MTWCPIGALAAAVLALPSAAAPQAHEVPGVEVSRVVLEARVLDPRGRAIPDLEPDDFRLEVDGDEVALETALWVPDGVEPSSSGTVAAAAERLPPGLGPEAIPGRLIVLLFQKDHRGSRLQGLLQLVHHASYLLEQFGPDDQVAVLVHDTQLRLHLDFTSSRGALERTLSHSVLNEWPAPPDPGRCPSLASHLDPFEVREADTPEEALLVLARALEALPRTKTLLVFGWGVGRMEGGVVTLSADYERAREILNRSRTSVFSIDVVDADYHTLEVTLEQVARDTGGLYVRMHDHPRLALSRVAEALSGHYVLSFERPDGPRGRHRIALALAGRRGTVLTRHEYVD